MKRFKKFGCTALAATLAFSALTACGSSDTGSTTAAAGAAQNQETTTAAAPAAEGEKTVVEVWSNDRHDQEYVQQMVDKYNAENTDNIQINLQIITEDYGNMLALAYSGGTAPDVIGQNADVTLNQFADTGIIYPLNEFIDADEEFKKVIQPETQQYEGLNVKDGKMYFAFSGMRSGVRVEYNKQLLADAGYTEIPKNLDEYIAMAQAVTDKGAGQYYGIGFTSSSPFERLLEMSAQVSGIYYYDYVNGKFDFSGYKPILEKGFRKTADIACTDAAIKKLYTFPRRKSIQFSHP